MRMKVFHFLILGVCLLLVGCEQASDPEGEGNVMNTDIKHINNAPKATEMHPIDKVVNVFFSEWTMDVPPITVAVDIENNEVYKEPSMGRRGLRAQGGIVSIRNAEEVVAILEKYDVQDWKTDYTFEDPTSYEDGYSWKLWLQFADGTVEKHAGEGTDKGKLTPDHFDEFVGELQGFVEGELKGEESK